MKTKYERMNKEEKNELYKNYKKEHPELIKKMERMFVLCIIGIICFVLIFLYDFFISKSLLNYLTDIIVLVFCIIALFKLNVTKKDILNKYALEKSKKNKRV